MFCARCGSEVQEGSAFCGRCGAPIRPQGEEMTIKKHRSKKPLVLCMIVAVIIIGVIAVVIHNSGSSGSSVFKRAPYEKPIKNYFEGIEKQDVDMVKSAFHGAHLSYMPNNFTEDKMDRVYSDLEDKFGYGFKISYKINSAEELSEREANNIQDTFSAADNLTEVNITLTIKGDTTQEYNGDLIIASFDDNYDILKAGGYVYAWDDVLSAFDEV